MIDNEGLNSDGKSENLPSTPTPSEWGSHPQADTKLEFSKIEMPQGSDSIEDKTPIVFPLPAPVIPEKRGRGRPKKSEALDRRAEQIEASLELKPDDEGEIPIDFDNGKEAIGVAFRNELSRKVLIKGRLKINAPSPWETKLRRVVRKAVNLAMAGDRDMIKLVLERFGGRTAMAPKAEASSTFVIENRIPSPEDAGGKVAPTSGE
jgi:hypothetical protein